MVLEAIEKYIEAIRKTEEWGNIVGQMLVDTLSPIIPDIEYSLGWAEAGVDTICLWSERYKVGNVDLERLEEQERLADIIGEIFDGLAWHVDCPFGVWLPPDVAKEVREVLEELKRKG